VKRRRRRKKNPDAFGWILIAGGAYVLWVVGSGVYEGVVLGLSELGSGS
jgi:hypothetical protein